MKLQLLIQEEIPNQNGIVWPKGTLQKIAEQINLRAQQKRMFLYFPDGTSMEHIIALLDSAEILENKIWIEILPLKPFESLLQNVKGKVNSNIQTDISYENQPIGEPILKSLQFIPD